MPATIRLTKSKQKRFPQHNKQGLEKIMRLVKGTAQGRGGQEKALKAAQAKQ